MRAAVTSLLGSGITMALLLIATGRAPADSVVLSEHPLFERPLASCASPGADNGAFRLLGPRLPESGAAYRINQKTFPQYLAASEIQAGIDSSFAAWDNATSAALFTKLGTTDARPGFKDGVNTVGFGSVKNGVVAVASMWSNKSGAMIEFDVTLSTRLAWATNPAGGGDCQGLPAAFDIQNIVTHEAGHVAGLADVYKAGDNAQSMFGYAAPGELFKRTLASGDQAGLASVYGP